MKIPAAKKRELARLLADEACGQALAAATEGLRQEARAFRRRVYPGIDEIPAGWAADAINKATLLLGL